MTLLQEESCYYSLQASQLGVMDNYFSLAVVCILPPSTMENSQ